MTLFRTYDGVNGKALIFAPEKGFNLEFFAELIVQVMLAAGTGARVWLPNDVIADFDQDCTAEEIIEGYRNFLGEKMPHRHSENENKIGSVS